MNFNSVNAQKRVKVYRWWNPIKGDWWTLAENELPDEQLFRLGYSKKIHQFDAWLTPGELWRPNPVHRWFHPRDKDWISLAGGEIPDYKMRAWGYEQKTFQFYASRRRESGTMPVTRWWHRASRDWVTLADEEIPAESLRCWGYTSPIHQFYALRPANWKPLVEIYPEIPKRPRYTPAGKGTRFTLFNRSDGPRYLFISFNWQAFTEYAGIVLPVGGHWTIDIPCGQWFRVQAKTDRSPVGNSVTYDAVGIGECKPSLVHITEAIYT